MTKSSKSLPVGRRADFGRLLLWGLGFLFLGWRGGTGFGPLLGERKTLRHVLTIHKAEKGLAQHRRDAPSIVCALQTIRQLVVSVFSLLNSEKLNTEVTEGAH